MTALISSQRERLYLFIVADVFHAVTLKYRKKFETIEYAVYHTDREAENYRAFQKAFREIKIS